MKLILGTVQFGMPYGIVNTLGRQPSVEDMKNILDYAWDNEIRTLDSAVAYGVANRRIEEYHQKTDKRFKVINKIMRVSLQSLDEFELIKISLKDELKKMELPHFEVVMLHYAYSVSKSFCSAHLSSLVEEGIALKTGLSINTEAEYRLLEKKFKFNVIQLPLNILNQSFIKNEFLLELKDKGIEIHARSIFMQGLLISGSSSLPMYLADLEPYLVKIESLAFENMLSLKAIALTFVMQNKYVDKIVFGVQSKQELVEILDSYKEITNLGNNSVKIAWNEFACPDFFLVDPNQWNIRKRINEYK